MKTARMLGLVGLFLVFTVFSVVTTVKHGYFGFLHNAARDPWGLQVLLDLGISMTLFTIWMVRDAREKKLPFWPYVVAIPALGSIAALAYLIHRERKL